MTAKNFLPMPAPRTKKKFNQKSSARNIKRSKRKSSPRTTGHSPSAISACWSWITRVTAKTAPMTSPQKPVNRTQVSKRPRIRWLWNLALMLLLVGCLADSIGTKPGREREHLTNPNQYNSNVEEGHGTQPFRQHRYNGSDPLILKRALGIVRPARIRGPHPDKLRRALGIVRPAHIRGPSTGLLQPEHRLLKRAACRSHQWQCADGGCIWHHAFRCDGRSGGEYECSDGSDEEGCESYQCRGVMVPCGGANPSHLCVHHWRRCDGVDDGRCGGVGGGEEVDCESYQCRDSGGWTMVKCGGANPKHQCVHHTERCTGVDNGGCGGRGGGEEVDCESYQCRFPMIPCPGANKHLCVIHWDRCDGVDDGRCGGVGGEEVDCDSYQCRDDYVKCGGANRHLCTQHLRRCDGDEDGHCGGVGGGEEEDCDSHTCRGDLGSVKCGGANRHMCVWHERRCDGHDEGHCGGVGGGEEEDCKSFQCRLGRVKCGGGANRHLCVHHSDRCTGGPPCGEEEDCESYQCRGDMIPCGGANPKHLCLHHQFRCGSHDSGRCGGHGAEDEHCDRREDCPLPWIKCPTGPGCIIKEWRCDGWESCRDRSDEEHCESYNCRHPYIKCPTSEKCFHHLLRCNGVNDSSCGNDELYCNTQGECPESWTKCADGKGCVKNTWRCDGMKNCQDESDEANCDTYRCHRNMVKCGDKKRCMDRHWRCDDIDDCDDASDDEKSSDEAGCDTCELPDLFHCADKKDCIHFELRCDGSTKCQDQSDEDGCGHCPPGFLLSHESCYVFINKTETHQAAEQTCIRMYWESFLAQQVTPADTRGIKSVIHHTQNNAEGAVWLANSGNSQGKCKAYYVNDERTGEDTCDKKNQIVCQVNPASEYCFAPWIDCHTGPGCTLVSQRCDGVQNCLDGSDETDCETKNGKCTRETDFACINRHCIDRHLRCDGSDQCGDDSDESMDECYYQKGQWFRCLNNKTIEQFWRCNGEAHSPFDCGDGSDEWGCGDYKCMASGATVKCGDTIKKTCVKYRGHSACSGASHLCIEYLLRCDGWTSKYRCDGLDEVDCDHYECPTGLEKCGGSINSSACMQPWRRCNRVRDACGSNKMDEEGCGYTPRPRGSEYSPVEWVAFILFLIFLAVMFAIVAFFCIRECWRVHHL